MKLKKLLIHICWWDISQFIEPDFTWWHMVSFGLQGAEVIGSVLRKGRTFLKVNQVLTKEQDDFANSL